MKDRPPKIVLPRSGFVTLQPRAGVYTIMRFSSHGVPLEQQYMSFMTIDCKKKMVVKDRWREAHRRATVEDMVFMHEMEGEPWTN